MNQTVESSTISDDDFRAMETAAMLQANPSMCVLSTALSALMAGIFYGGVMWLGIESINILSEWFPTPIEMMGEHYLLAGLFIFMCVLAYRTTKILGHKHQVMIDCGETTTIQDVKSL